MALVSLPVLCGPMGAAALGLIQTGAGRPSALDTHGDPQIRPL